MESQKLRIWEYADLFQRKLILMVLDDVGWSDVGYHGSDFPTPHIDELAATGVKLGRFYGACKSRPIHPR